MISVLQKTFGEWKRTTCAWMLPHEAKNNELRWNESQVTKLFQPGGRLTWEAKNSSWRAPVPSALLLINILISLMVLNNSFWALFSTYRGTFFWKKRVYSLQWVGNLTGQRNISWDLMKTFPVVGKERVPNSPIDEINSRAKPEETLIVSVEFTSPILRTLVFNLEMYT